ncbi:hypothetical protein RUND412_005187 [Rhizina undulata]
MDPQFIASGTAGVVRVIPLLLDVCVKGYGMLASAQNGGEDWGELQSRCEAMAGKFVDWKKQMQLPNRGLAVLEPGSKQCILIVESLAHIVECFRKIDEFNSKQGDQPSRFSCMKFWSKSNSTPTSPTFPSAKVLEDLPQISEKHQSEVEKAVKQFEENAKQFEEASLKPTTWTLSGKKRVTKAVETLEKYSNNLFELTKDLHTQAKDKSESSGANALMTTSQEFYVQVQLPLQRNPEFCGRKEVLDRMCQTLGPREPAEHPGKPAVVRSTPEKKLIILHGLPEIGKSQISLEYAYRFSQCYTSIFLIDATDFSSIKNSACKVVEQLARHYAAKRRPTPDSQKFSDILGLPESIDSSGRLKESAAEVAVNAVQTWLSAIENRGWLLIVENASSAGGRGLDKLVPTCDWGTVVMTTRLTNLHGLGECIEVKGLGPDAGLEFLLQCSRRDHREMNEFEFEEAQTIVAKLEERPVDLRRAGTIISSLRIPFYVYRMRIGGVVESDPNKETSEPPSYRPSVLMTWELSFEELSDSARQVIQLCGFLSNEDIPVELFVRGKSALSWFCDENKFNEAIKNLYTFSMAKPKDSSDSLYVHPLVHTWARDRNDVITRRKFAEEAILLVAAAVSNEEDRKSPDHWQFERRILNHLKVSQDNIHKNFRGSTKTNVAEAALAIALAYEDLGYHKDAEALCLSALAVFEKAFGKDHIQTLETVNRVAGITSNQNRYDDALELYQRALSGREKALGKDHPSTLKTVSCIEATKQKQFEAAKETNEGNATPFISTIQGNVCTNLTR